jgi:hypothetical protein
MGVWLASMIVWALSIVIFSMFIFFPRGAITQEKAIDRDWVVLQGFADDVKADITRMKDCKVDEDCVLVWGSCPFGMEFINRKQVDLFHQKINSYQQQMDARGKQCMGEWSPSIPAVCRSGKCAPRECELNRKYEQMSFEEVPCSCPAPSYYQSEQNSSNDGFKIFECVQHGNVKH